MLPQSAVAEQWIWATLAGAQYVMNAQQKFSQTVLIERNRQVPCFCEILRFCKQQLDYQLFSFKRCWYPKFVFYVWQICSFNFTLFLLIMYYMMFDYF